MAGMDTIVVVGAGLAAAKAVETLREEGFEGRITLVGSEKHLPYERPPLSKEVLLGDKQTSEAVLHDADWYAERDVTVREGVTVTSLDTDAKRLQLDSGEPLEYDALLLATGAEPRVLDVPGADKAVYLRTIEDSERLDAVLASGGPLVVVGGGWIGLEVAAAARSRDVPVTLLERGDLPLANVLGRELAQHLAEMHLTHGVDLRTRTEVSQILLEGDETTGVVTPDGTIHGTVVVAVGAEPSVGLASDAGLDVDDGIVTDEHFRTSADGVWAAGDVAKVAHPRHGALRVEHWDNAIRQGQAAARSILGQDVTHDWEPYFFTDQYDFGMEYVGHAGPDDDVELRGDVSENAFIAYWLDGDTVTAAMNVGIWDVNDQLRELVGTTVDRADLTDLR